ncbi:MAG: hypothetical protein WDA71_03355 [Actinomycetota bacterium]
MKVRGVGVRGRIVRMLAAGALATVGGLPAAVGPVRAASTQEVTISDGGYSPVTVTVVPGTMVVWTNQGQNFHSVSSDSGSADSFDSGPMPPAPGPNSQFSHTFEQTGTFSYRSTMPGDSMAGTVVVKSAGTASPSPPKTSTPKPPSPSASLKSSPKATPSPKRSTPARITPPASPSATQTPTPPVVAPASTCPPAGAGAAGSPGSSHRNGAILAGVMIAGLVVAHVRYLLTADLG